MRILRIVLGALVIVSSAGLFCSALSLIFNLYPIGQWPVVAFGAATLISFVSWSIIADRTDECDCDDCVAEREERERMRQIREEWQ
jgi:hypothetical protein